MKKERPSALALAGVVILALAATAALTRTAKEAVPLGQRPMVSSTLSVGRSGGSGEVRLPTWATSYGGFLAYDPSAFTEYDSPRRVVQAFDGSLLVAGDAQLKPSGSGDWRGNILVVKATPLGDVVWRGVFPADSSATYHYYATDIVPTPDGGCLVIGNRIDGKSGVLRTKPLVMKLGPEGTLDWQTFLELPGDYDIGIKSAALLADGRFAIVGGDGEANGVFVLDSLGVLSWSKLLTSPEGTGESILWAVRATADGGLAATGSSRTGRAELLKFGPAGDLDWQKSYDSDPHAGYSLWSGGIDLAVTPAGGFLLLGMTSYFNDSEARQGFWVCGLDASGGVQWQKGYPLIFGAETLALTQDGGCVIFAARAEKLNAQGALEWVRNGTQLGISAGCQLADGTYVWSGPASGATPAGSLVLVHTDLDGLVGGSCRVLDTESDTEYATTVHAVPATLFTPVKHSPVTSSLTLTRREGPLATDAICPPDTAGFVFWKK